MILELIGLDLLGTIKLVNFIRNEVKEGRGQALKVSNERDFGDDRYLQPVLEDDALLYNLEDIIENETNPALESTASTSMPSGVEAGSGAYVKINELQESLLQTQQAFLATQQRLELAEKALSLARDDTKPFSEAPSPSQKSAAHAKYEGNYDGPGEHPMF